LDSGAKKTMPGSKKTKIIDDEGKMLVKHAIFMLLFMMLALGLSFASMISFNYIKIVTLENFHLSPGKMYTIYQLTNITDTSLIIDNTSYIRFSPTSHGTAKILMSDVVYNKSELLTISSNKGAEYPISSLDSVITIGSVTSQDCTVNITIYISGYEHKLSILAIPGMIAALVSLALMFKLLVQYTLTRIPYGKRKK